MTKADPGQGAAPGDGDLIRPARFQPPRAVKPGRGLRFRPVTIIGLVLLTLCAATAWFLFAARAVYMETEPASADITVASFLEFRIGNRFLLLPGAHDVHITAPGYHPLRESIVVGDEQNQEISFSLERLPGHLLVDSGPVAGATVTLDGERAGATPLRIDGVEHGEHAVRVTADRYFPFEDTIHIEGLGKEQTLKVDLVPAWADVELSSEPPGAEVLVDDERVGVTPLVTGILEGRHSLRVKAPGYKDWHRELKITAGEGMSFDEIELEPADAVIYLVSEPAAASTTVNGEYKGLTPLEIALEPNARSTIRLYKQGYRGAVRELSAKPGDNQRLTIRLQPELAAVEISVEPPDADIYIDGVHRGKGGMSLQLPARQHHVEARREGYVDGESTVTPRTGLTQQVQLRLQTLEQARLASIKPTIQTSGKQTLKLFRPGSFTMGASRREPGRRANETLKNVKLTRPFYLALKEVSNAEFREFEAGHSSGRVQSYSLDGDQQPVVMITWEQAALYCNWLSKADSLPAFYRVENGKVVGYESSSPGYRLPTEAEWAWAARVSGDGAELRYPWGQEMPPPKGSGNFADEVGAGIIGEVIHGYDDGHAVTAPVGSYAANQKGLFDMGGNASEWINDYYGIDPVNLDATFSDPMGPETGEFHVIRGSSWAHGTVSELRLSFRDYGKDPRPDVGFRIARFLD